MITEYVSDRVYEGTRPIPDEQLARLRVRAWLRLPAVRAVLARYDDCIKYKVVS